MAIDREALTRQIKEASDIVDVVGGYLTLLPAGTKFKGLCPFHDDHRPSLVVDPQWQNFRCWACGKTGDVFTFIQEKERVDFREARELLARRAGISLEKIPDSPQNLGRAAMLDVMRWADELYQRCLRESYNAEAARRYLEERKLTAETIRRFGLGFAPPTRDWLVQHAVRCKISLDMLEKVGLVGRGEEGGTTYDRFRERIIFPIRNSRGQTVGFGGRILPSSAVRDRVPKYYNSAETPLFSKSEQLYGLDHARQAGSLAGYLAVVEGYTDVLMAHQHGICQVVATMGTALNSRHVQQLRRIVPRVVLVFDADAGGASGVDRALELFVRHDMELAIATLPEGLDPCDLLVQHGPEPFLGALAAAQDALDFKLNQVLASPAAATVEGKRRGVEEILTMVAQIPEQAGQAGQIKRELVLSRIAHRLGLREATLWQRLDELRKKAEPPRKPDAPVPPRPRAAPHERDLIAVLLAEPGLVPLAMREVPAGQVENPDVRRVLETMYAIQSEGVTPSMELFQERIGDGDLINRAFQARDMGLTVPNRAAWLDDLLAVFRKKREDVRQRELQVRLQSVDNDEAALNLLRQLQEGDDRVASVETVHDAP